MEGDTLRVRNTAQRVVKQCARQDPDRVILLRADGDGWITSHLSRLWSLHLGSKRDNGAKGDNCTHAVQQ